MKDSDYVPLKAQFSFKDDVYDCNLQVKMWAGIPEYFVYIEGHLKGMLRFYYNKGGWYFHSKKGKFGTIGSELGKAVEDRFHSVTPYNVKLH